MSLSDFALLFMIIVAALVVVPILKREITRPPSHNWGDLARTPEDRAVLEEVDRVLPSDPATAQRILHDHFGKVDQREEAERAALRDQAQTNRSAAEELGHRLREDLEVWQAIRKHSRKNAADPTARQALPNLDKWENETRTELAQVEGLIRKLKA